MNSGIYMIRNKINNKVYIGSSINVHHRIKKHISYLNNKYPHCNEILLREWNKYGQENFEFIILEYCPEEYLLKRESYWIKKFNALNRLKGYNLVEPERHLHSEETKTKISIKQFGEKNSFFGKTHTDKVRKRISKANRKPKSEEHKKKLSMAVKGSKDEKARRNEEILKLLEQKVRIKEIMERYNISKSQIYWIKHKYSQSHSPT